MDSRLINVIHDDPFDGNYAAYSSEPSFWSNESDSLDMQLVDTLDGILPITVADDANAIYSNPLIRDHDESLMHKNSLIYNGFAEQEFENADNIEILTVDPEAIDFDTEDDASNDEDELVENVNFDAESQSSYGTFRTRTDSSSIGDYESHSSDYDDFNELEDALRYTEENKDIQCSPNRSFSEINLPTNNLTLDTAFKLPLLASDNNERELCTNTNASDVDGLGIPIDFNNFDLAEFITKDDFEINTKKPTKTTLTQTPSKSGVNPAPIGNEKSLNYVESDCDSDTIVDVETIEIGEPLWSVQKDTVVPTSTEDDIVFVDNVKTDPSWCPKQTTKKAELNTKEAKPLTQTTSPLPEKSKREKVKRGICLVPSKKQCEFLKRKVGAKSTLTSSPTKINIKVAKKGVAKKAKDVASSASVKVQKPNTTSKQIDIGRGGKNLAMLQQIKRISCTSTTKAHEVEATIVEKEYKTTAVPSVKTISSPPVPPVKRKLNLEEYKKRRGVAQTSTNCGPPNKQQKQDTEAVPKAQSNCVKSTLPSVPAPLKTSLSKHNPAITEIVQTLKAAAVQPKPMTDPITEAKNKVLRMQQIKRAQQLKILDSAVSAKVPRVTKLPPLKDLVKGSYCLAGEKDVACRSPTKLHPDYEEITIVSASCNTDISIPPINERKELGKYSSRSLLKSSALLNNISDSFQRVQQSNDKPKILTSSLIASIQSEVVKKTQPTIIQDSNTNATKGAQHGEDKTIMYLPKNRDRKRTVSMGVQTELLPEFPLLTLIKRPTVHKSRERTRHKSRAYRKRNTSRSSSVSSAASASCGDGASITSPMRSQRSGSECCSNASTERMRHSDATAAGGYSSRSTRRHRSSVSSSSYSEQEDYERSRRQRRTSYNKRRTKNYGRSDSITSTSSESDYVQSRARSRSPHYRRSRSTSRSRVQRNNYNSNSSNLRRNFVDQNVSQPAVEERRIVYVGRIEQETTKDMLRRKFLRYGTIKTISIHLKETGMKYGFVTFERAQDAFTAIDSSVRDMQINMYDISFGGRRAFCRASYADLDNAGINNYHSYVYPKPAPPVKEDDSFEALLSKVKAKLNANKPAAVAHSSENTRESHNGSKI